jgi:lysozyme family protein
MTEARFPICLAHTLGHEGGYADHPSDPGGATNMGITHKTLARWRKVSPWWNLPKSAVKALGRAEAGRIYEAGYWIPSKAGAMPAGLDLALFDFAVNSGVPRAVRTLQAGLGVKADGLVGPLTLDAIRKRVALEGAATLVNMLCDRRLGFLGKLGTWTVFGKGWTNRVAAVRRAALAASGATAPQTSTKSTTWSELMDFLNGYKTYIVAACMLLMGLMQVLGLTVPTLEGASAGQMIMEALAVFFLRQGVKGDISRA